MNLEIKLEQGKTLTGKNVIKGLLYTDCGIYSSYIQLDKDRDFIKDAEYMVNELLNLFTNKISTLEEN